MGNNNHKLASSYRDNIFELLPEKTRWLITFSPILFVTLKSASKSVPVFLMSITRRPPKIQRGHFICKAPFFDIHNPFLVFLGLGLPYFSFLLVKIDWPHIFHSPQKKDVSDEWVGGQNLEFRPSNMHWMLSLHTSFKYIFMMVCCFFCFKLIFKEANKREGILELKNITKVDNSQWGIILQYVH